MELVVLRELLLDMLTSYTAWKNYSCQETASISTL